MWGNTTVCLAMLRGALRCCAPFGEAPRSTNQYGLKHCKELSTNFSLLLTCEKYARCAGFPLQILDETLRMGEKKTKKKNGPGHPATSSNPWGISIKLLQEVHDGWAGMSSSLHLPHLDRVSHTHKHTVTALAVGFNPRSSCVPPTVHCRTPEIILAFADSHRMLILSLLLFLLRCSVKSKSYFQLLLLLLFPQPHLSLFTSNKIHKNLPDITSSNSFLLSAISCSCSSPKICWFLFPSLKWQGLIPILCYPFSPLAAQPSLSAPHWSSHPQEHKTPISLS